MDGPFEPVTVPLDGRVARGHAVDLPASDFRLQRKVTELEPEQISVSLSATEDSVWISWVTGRLSSSLLAKICIMFLLFNKFALNKDFYRVIEMLI